MNIAYLQRLYRYNSRHKIVNLGFTENEISAFEKRSSIFFPKAYREFLFLAGKETPLFDDWNPCFLDEKLQKEIMIGLKAIPRDLGQVWAFLYYNGEEQLMFFDLNETDNPPVFGFYDNRMTEEEPFTEQNFEIKELYSSFSSCVNYYLRLHRCP